MVNAPAGRCDTTRLRIAILAAETDLFAGVAVSREANQAIVEIGVVSLRGIASMKRCSCFRPFEVSANIHSPAKADDGPQGELQRHQVSELTKIEVTDSRCDRGVVSGVRQDHAGCAAAGSARPVRVIQRS